MVTTRKRKKGKGCGIETLALFVTGLINTKKNWSSRIAQLFTNMTSSHGDTGSIPGLAQWVKDPVLPWLCCRSQMQLRSRVVAVAVAVA